MRFNSKEKTLDNLKRFSTSFFKLAKALLVGFGKACQRVDADKLVKGFGEWGGGAGGGVVHKEKKEERTEKKDCGYDIINAGYEEMFGTK